VRDDVDAISAIASPAAQVRLNRKPPSGQKEEATLTFFSPDVVALAGKRNLKCSSRA
jgi:hypothetical protein